MQHTLIPSKERNRLHREYYVRVIIVFLCIMCISVLVGAAALFPVYLKAWIGYNAAQNAVAAVRASKTDANIDAVSKELASDNEIVKFLSEDSGAARLSDVVRSIISVKGPISLSTFKVDRAGKKSVSLMIAGVAPKREDLIAFKGRLESLVPGTSVDLPISQLAKNTDIPFSFRFTQQLP